MKYFKIYHYSSPYNPRFEYIDPKYYGQGVTRGSECKYGKTGLNKSYFYTKDDPETCVSSNAIRYEIYLPYKWKEKIYDIGGDGSLYKEAKRQLEEAKNFPYIIITDAEIWQRLELLIKENGYIGWTNSLSQLPHVIVLFEKIATKKPAGEYIAYDWSGNILESTVNTRLKTTSFFSASGK